MPPEAAARLIRTVHVWGRMPWRHRRREPTRGRASKLPAFNARIKNINPASNPFVTLTVSYRLLPSLTVSYRPLPSLTVSYRPLPSLTVPYRHISGGTYGLGLAVSSSGLVLSAHVSSSTSICLF